eukprot:2561013-Pyramimonas_sp.AAC.1
MTSRRLPPTPRPMQVNAEASASPSAPPHSAGKGAGTIPSECISWGGLASPDFNVFAVLAALASEFAIDALRRFPIPMQKLPSSS